MRNRDDDRYDREGEGDEGVVCRYCGDYNPVEIGMMGDSRAFRCSACGMILIIPPCKVKVVCEDDELMDNTLGQLLATARIRMRHELTGRMKDIDFAGRRVIRIMVSKMSLGELGAMLLLVK